MKNKKGFTLVELLAVIVILAIIALIATPLVIKYVNEAREESVKISLDNIEKAADMYFVSNDIKTEIVLDLTSNIIELKNNNISKGIVVGSRNKIKTYIYQNGYCGIKEENKIVVKKTTEEDCDFNTDDSIEVVTTNKVSKEQKITGYRIYGDTIDNNSLGSNNNQIVLKLTGKNLFDKSQSLHQGIRDESSFSAWAATTMDHNWVINNLKPNIQYTITFSAECLSVPDYDSNGAGNFGFLLYSGVSGYSSVWFNTSAKYFKLGEKYSSTRTVTTPVNLLDEAANYRILVYTNYYKKDNLMVYGQLLFRNIQIEEGNEATAYEPYMEPKEYTISLKEPLRKIGNKEDYIDSSISQIVRNVGVKEDGSLYELEKPTYEYIKLPTISNLDGTTIVSVNDGNMSASKIEIMVQK